MPSLFPCSPVIREYSCKETQIEKKMLQIKFLSFTLIEQDLACVEISTSKYKVTQQRKSFVFFKKSEFARLFYSNFVLFQFLCHLLGLGDYIYCSWK